MKWDKFLSFPDQHTAMTKFYHERDKTYLPYIELLSDSNINYCQIYDEVTSTFTKKTDNIVYMMHYKLKKVIINTYSCKYYRSQDIMLKNLDTNK